MSHTSAESRNRYIGDHECTVNIPAESVHTKISYRSDFTGDLLLGIVPKTGKEVDDEVDSLLPRLIKDSREYVDLPS